MAPWLKQTIFSVHIDEDIAGMYVYRKERRAAMAKPS